MNHRWFTLFLFGVLACVAEASVYDQIVSADLEDIINEERIVVLMKQTRQSKRAQLQPETLFNLRFPGESQRFSLKLNRDTDTVTLESGDSALRWTEDGLGDGGSLAIELEQIVGNGMYVSLYKGCKFVSKFHAPTSFRSIYNQMDKSSLKMKREKHLPLSVLSGSAEKVLGCPFLVFDKPKSLEKKSADPEVMQADEPVLNNNIPYRGDIPMIHTENCDDLLVRSINELIKMVQLLKNEVLHQREEIRHLRDTLANCAGCKEPDTRVRCNSNPGPCYPG